MWIVRDISNLIITQTTRVTNYSVRVHAARDREHGWYISFTLCRGCTLSPRVVLPLCLGLQLPKHFQGEQAGYTTKLFSSHSNKEQSLRIPSPKCYGVISKSVTVTRSIIHTLGMRPIPSPVCPSCPFGKLLQTRKSGCPFINSQRLSLGGAWCGLMHTF